MKHKIIFLNTRPEPQNTQLSTQLSAILPLNVIQLPTIEIQTIAEEKIQAQLNQAPPADYYIFTSINAVENSFCGLKKWCKTALAIAIGEKTKSLLQAKGWENVICPEEACSEGILSLPLLNSVKNKHVMILTGGHGRTLLKEALHAKGALITEIICYHRVIPRYQKAELMSKEQLSHTRIVLITSVECYENLKVLLGNSFNILLQTSQWLVFGTRVKQHILPNVPEQNITVCKPSDQAVLNATKLLCKEF